MKRLISLTVILVLLATQMQMIFATENTFINDLNNKIDSAQEKLNDAAENIDAAAEKVGQVIDDTKESIDQAVEAIKVILSDLDNHWAKQYIDELIGRKVVSGYPDGTFKPNASISVSEFTKILMAGAYDDMDYPSSTPWYQSYLDTALDKGIILNGEYKDYTREITRYEMARMIARAGEDQGKFEITNTTSTNFGDDNKISSAGKPYIKAVSDVGIITGYPNGNFGPADKATRAEASVMLNRLLDLKASTEVAPKKTIVEIMLENALASTMVKPISKEKIQQLVDEKNTVYCKPGCIMENSVIKVRDSENMEQALIDIVDIGQVLQVHAEKNGQMVGFAGGGNGVSVQYGENIQQLNKLGGYMFSIRYYRDVDWANEIEIEGKMYQIDKEVVIDGGLFDGVRLQNEMTNSDERVKYRKERIDMEEDVLMAFYDGLRALDKDRSQALFNKMTADYIYAKTHDYGDPNNPKQELFEIDGQLIFREDTRSSDAGFRYNAYKFLK